ncbi:MAG: glutathione S-transferase family protein [Sphingomonadaceae bacterium]
MILHGASVSPFVRKVLVYAAEKGLALEYRAVGIGPKTPEFMALSPFGKIPAFEDGDYGLCDSTAIVTYLEALHPAPELIPSEPRARGRAIWFEEFADTIMVGQLGPVFFNRVLAPMLGMPADTAAADKGATEHWPKIADYLESAIPASGYLIEDRLTIADIAVAAPLVNAGYAGLMPDAATHPKLHGYAHAILGRASFADAIARDKKMIGLDNPYGK